MGPRRNNLPVPYTPPRELLDRYAAILVRFALHGGSGVRPGEVVHVQVPESAKPFYVPLRDAVLAAGAFPIMQLLAEDVDEAGFFSKASPEQLSFFPGTYFRGLVDQIDHTVSIIAEWDKYLLRGVDPKLILTRSSAMRPYKDWREAKELDGRYTWTLALYGTEAMAADVGMTIEAYWEQIIAACYLDQPDPVATWQATYAELDRIKAALNALAINRLHLIAPDVDLWVGLGEGRQWLGGGGRNIPSFELFTSPDWRRTEGSIAFNQPLFHYGNRISGIRLRFEGGTVVEAHAEEGEALLTEMLATPGANRLGEVSLTDGRFSRITQVMGETLYDENLGGPEGNTHVAVGSAYKDAYPGDQAALTPEAWDQLGYNESVVHTDIISTAPRTVVAYLADGSERVIYAGGRFTV